MWVKSSVRAVEDWWFETTRSVRTSGNEHTPESSKVKGELRDGCIYGPVRVANARKSLHDLPIDDYSEYTFIDIGSGKGRALFVAAELPFRKILGIEYSVDLHEMALENIRRWSHVREKCSDIESVYANAADFEFPNQKLVLYLFNPFGPDVMNRMLTNLERSLKRNPRHVVMVMLWPEQSQIVAQVPWMHLYKQTRRYHIYQTACQSEND